MNSQTPSPADEIAARILELSRAKEHQAVRALVLQAIALYPDNPLIQRRAADHYAWYDQPDVALGYAQRAMELTAPDDVGGLAGCYSSLAHVYQRQGDPAKAEAMLLEFKQRFPTARHLDRQLKRLQRRDLNDAMRPFIDQAQKQRSEGAPVDALFTLLDGIRQHGFMIHAVETAVSVAVQVGRLNMAQNMLQEWREAEPQQPYAAWMLGNLMARRCQFVSALPHLRAAMNMAPDNMHYMYSYYNTQLRMAVGRPAALNIIAPELRRRLSPGKKLHPMLGYLAGRFYFVMNEYPAALDFLQPLVDKDDTPATHLYLAMLKPGEARYRAVAERIGGERFGEYLDAAKAICRNHGLLFEDATAAGAAAPISPVYDRADLAPVNKGAGVVVSATPQRDDGYLLERGLASAVVNPRRTPTRR